MNKLLAAAAALGLLSAPQIASASPSRAPQTVNISVNADGLDLSRPSDVRTLRNRIADAAAEACDPADCGFRGDRARCSDLMARGIPR